MNIYGTLGPACSDVRTLESMLRSGMTGARLNLSHCSIDEAAPMIEALHTAAANVGVKAALLIDMQGPELRIGALAEPLFLTEGEQFSLGAGGVPVPAAVLPYLLPGQELLLDDGKILSRVTENHGGSAMAVVLRGGVLQGRKSICLCGISIETPVLTDMDLENIRKAASYGVTWLMQPFVRRRQELEEVRAALDKKVGPESAQSLHAKGQVELVLLLELALLGVGHDGVAQLLGLDGRERRRLERDQLAVDAQLRR